MWSGLIACKSAGTFLSIEPSGRLQTSIIHQKMCKVSSRLNTRTSHHTHTVKLRLHSRQRCVPSWAHFHLQTWISVAFIMKLSSYHKSTMHVLSRKCWKAIALIADIMWWWLSIYLPLLIEQFGKNASPMTHQLMSKAYSIRFTSISERADQ